MTNIITRLKLPITAPSEMPKGFAALTYPIPLAQEEIIQSIWTSLRSTEALVTVAGDAVEFWRRVKRSASPSHAYNGVVKTAR
jgi:hypothetical protein